MADTLKLYCDQCGASNRVPTERLDDGPQCGRCQNALTGRPLLMTDANAPALLRRSDLPVLVDCWADWCGPCKAFAPVFEAAAQKYAGRLVFAKLDTQNNPASAGAWQIRSIPTLILFRQGKEADRVSGALPASALDQWIAGATSRS